MAKQMMSFRLNPMHNEMLEEIVDFLRKEGIETNKTVVLEKAIYNFAREVLERSILQELMDRHYSNILNSIKK